MYVHLQILSYSAAIDCIYTYIFSIINNCYRYQKKKQFFSNLVLRQCQKNIEKRNSLKKFEVSTSLLVEWQDGYANSTLAHSSSPVSARSTSTRRGATSHPRGLVSERRICPLTFFRFYNYACNVGTYVSIYLYWEQKKKLFVGYFFIPMYPFYRPFGTL